MVLSLLLAASLAAQPKVGVKGPIPYVPFPTGETQTINILNWDTNQLPKYYERSEQLPLTDDEIQKLSQAGFEPAQLVKMIEERQCACDASGDGMIRLKKAGVHKDVLAAISLHSIAPNRYLNLDVLIDFVGQSQSARENFLYFFIDDGDVTRVFTANIEHLLSRRYAHESMVDRSDILLARQVRRVQLPGQVPLKTYGKHTVLVAASANPTLTHPSQLTPAEREKAQTYTFDYPRSSLMRLCRLTAGYKRDAVLTYKWQFVGSRFECEWN